MVSHDVSTSASPIEAASLAPPLPEVMAETRATALQPRMRVLVADRAPLVRAGIRQCLHAAPDVEIVGEAADGPSAVQLAVALQPDLVILDLALPGTSGVEVMRAVGAEVAGVRMLVLAQQRLQEDVRAAFAAGAAGYMLKDDDVEHLPGILRALQAGRVHLSPQLSELVVREYVTGQRRAARMPSLTHRQTEIVSRIARGRTSREIGAELGITVRTVQTHRAHIMRRLQVHTEAGLVHAALHLGLLDHG
jgi:two-component system response regulator NreC